MHHYDIMRRSDVALFGVYEISKILNIPARLESTLSGVLQLLSSFLDMRHGLIALLDERGSPEIVVGSGWSEATAKKYFERLPEQAIGRIVVTKMPLVIESMRGDPLFENWDFSEWGQSADDGSFIGVPIKDRGKVMGTLTIEREYEKDAKYTLDEDVRFLSMIANLLGQTVHLQRLITRDRERLMDEQRRLEKTIEHAVPSDKVFTGPSTIIGTTQAISAVLQKVRRVARTNSPVLLRGESGTGKEMFADALHQLSPRSGAPFIAVNCAALAESVLESELFGHEKGSFTGAATQRKGRFEMADHGTLFLDEIGEISPGFQAKLLRVLQLGEFERLGGSQTIKVDVRVVAATNRNLEEMVAKGSFRSDLYYRVNVVPIFLPALRDRKGDIPLLAGEFLTRFNTEHGTHLSLSNGAMNLLTSCYFPGNVRELENCVRRTATLAQGECIMADDFSCRHDECMSAVLWRNVSDLSSSEKVPMIGNHSPAVHAVPSETIPVVSISRTTPTSHTIPAIPTVPAMPTTTTVMAGVGQDAATSEEGGVDVDRARLLEAMEKSGWVQAKAARLLGLTARQIGYALRKQGIELKKF